MMAFITRVNPRITSPSTSRCLVSAATPSGWTSSRALAAGIQLPMKSFSCTNVCYGSFTSWHNSTRPGVAVTVEFGRTVSSWRKDKAAAAVVSVGSRY